MQATAIKSEPLLRRIINSSIRADITLCYDCGACLTECPVNTMTDRLRSRELVRMANFGLIEELARSSQLWYCLSCGRCSNVCPMRVKPAMLIAYLRREALRRLTVTRELVSRIERVHRQLHRVRHQLAGLCLEGKAIPDLSSQWTALSEAPLVNPAQTSSFPDPVAASKAFRKALSEYMGFLTNVDSCFTCLECTNACPVSREPAVFDPLRIFRMITFGFRAELLRSPSLWLCLSCESCTRACSQNIKGHLVINRLKELAIEEGYVDIAFLRCWPTVQKAIYSQFLEEIDGLLESGR